MMFAISPAMLIKRAYNLAAVAVALVVAARALLAVPSATPAFTSPYPWPNNPFGTHLMIIDEMTDARIKEHLQWTLHCTDNNGYVKLFMYPITLERKHAEESWKTFIRRARALRLIPILRIGGVLNTPYQPGPHGDYREIAAKLAQIINELPKDPHIPLYIELGNEPNLRLENGGAMPDPAAYARFVVSASKALRALGRPDIRIANGALAPGGDYNNIKFVEAMCRAVPEFIDALDVWASHPYPANTPPEYNLHNGNAPVPQDCIDAYLLELAVLAQYTNRAFQVILTETGYAVGNQSLPQFPIVDELNRPDLEFRAFRDYWSQWPEVLAVTPFSLCGIHGGWEQYDWIEPTSGTAADGLPTQPKSCYTWVRQLAKPGTPWGTLSGKVTARETGLPIEGIVVTLAGHGQQTTEINGNYLFTRVEPGVDEVRIAQAGFAAAGRKAVRVNAGSNSVVNLALVCLRKGKLAGRVLDTAGRPLAGAVVVIDTLKRSAITGTNGTWAFQNLPPGRYDLKAERKGFYTHDVRRFALKMGQTATLNFNLGPGLCEPDKPYLRNPGFESTAYGVKDARPLKWDVTEGTAGAVHCDDAVRYAGFSAVRIDGTSKRTALGQWSDYSAIQQGRTVRFQVWCRTRGVTKQAFLRAKFMTNAGVLKHEAVSQPTTGDQDWRLLTLDVVAPAFEDGTGRAGLEVVLDSPRGSAWFDEAHLWEVPTNE
ncbi:MAG: carboxypeptidase-like regulatory domain-containing protein [bacterium]|nr:carboxypeptidase-like regulatory domain-containing protein [bacterium]